MAVPSCSMQTNPWTRTYLPSKALGVTISWTSETGSGCRGEEPGFSSSPDFFPSAALTATQAVTAKRKIPTRRKEARSVTRVSVGQGLRSNYLQLKDELGNLADWMSTACPRTRPPQPNASCQSH